MQYNVLDDSEQVTILKNISEKYQNISCMLKKSLYKFNLPTIPTKLNDNKSHTKEIGTDLTLTGWMWYP